MKTTAYKEIKDFSKQLSQKTKRLREIAKRLKKKGEAPIGDKLKNEFHQLIAEMDAIRNNMFEIFKVEMQ